MEQEKEQNLLIIIMSVILVLLIAVVIYLIFFNKKEEVIDNHQQNNTQVNEKLYSKIDGSKGNYYVITGQTYNVYSNFNNKKTQDEDKVVFDYPVININTSSVLNVNAKIKETFYNIEKEFKNKKEDGCICVKVNDYYHCDEHIRKLSFKVYEDTEFITIIVRNNLLTHCASGNVVDTVYTVSKKDGKDFSNDDIINYFGYNRDTINRELAKYIQSLYATNISNELEDIPKSLVLAINNGKLILGYDFIDGTQYFSYDGKSFKEENNTFDF